MTLNELRLLSSEVLGLLDAGGKAFSSFQASTGMTCPRGCGACCLNPNIHIPPIEALPYALFLFDQGKAMEIYEKLKDQSESVCHLYESENRREGKGRCSAYSFRFAICRSFGVAALRDKSGNKTMSVCSKLKTLYPEALRGINKENAPVMGSYAQRIKGLAPRLGGYMPVNEAIKRALEEILMASAYESDAPETWSPGKPA